MPASDFLGRKRSISRLPAPRKAELRIAAATAPFLQHSPERAIAAGGNRLRPWVHR